MDWGKKTRARVARILWLREAIQSYFIENHVQRCVTEDERFLFSENESNASSCLLPLWRLLLTRAVDVARLPTW